jgi:GNAT superfamily N-acetyltransferase
MAFTTHPLTPDRWSDLVFLFGPRGACGGCWCMTPRLGAAQYEKQKGAGNKRAFKRIVDSGAMPGVLGYRGDEPLAWCAVAPREEYARLARSRVLAPVDGEPVWSITCLFVAKEARNSGVSVKMIRAAADFARDQGARIVEGYPVVPKTSPMPPVFAYTGLLSAYEQAGFREVARRSDARPIVRKTFRRSR